MPISILNLNEAPYYDDYDLREQYHRVLFKPRFAVQARELTQLQTILQNQIEQFGDNIFQEGSIVKGCNFTEFTDLEFVKVRDRAGFDVTQYIGEETETSDITYELEGQITGLRASIIAAARGFETNDPNLNTFFIKYLNNNNAQEKTFQAGEQLNINRIRKVNDVIVTPESGDTPVTTINVTNRTNHVGKSFGLRISEGIIFQKGHFLFAEDQLVVVSKYTNIPDNVSIGYRVEERIVGALQDSTLYDNALGTPNENAPGADRLKLVPRLVVIPTAEAEADPTFFILSRYVAGNAVQVRDVSQYNVLGNEMAKRTYEESGDYITQDFDVKAVRRESANNVLQLAVGPGAAYIRGFRTENKGEIYINVDPIEERGLQTNQPISFNYGGYVDITALSGTIPFGTFDTVNLRNISDTVIGTAIVLNITPTKLYLFDIRMTGANLFNDVRSIVGVSGEIEIAANSVIREKSTASLVFDTGMFSLYNIENITMPLRDSRSLSGLSGTTVVINANINEDFAGITNDDIVFVDSTNTRIAVTNTSVSVDNSVLTLTLATAPSATATVYFNKRIGLTQPYSKLEQTVFVRVDFDTATRKYNLGFPDVFEIVSITDSASANVTASFKLKPNQKDHYYDHSYIEYVPGRPMPAAGELMIEMKVFQINSSTGQYFFTIDSYPNTLDANKIPVFTSSSGRTYNLRDCFDFRPYVDLLPGATYTATTSGAAPLVSDDTTGIDLVPSFTGTFIVPAVKNAGQADLEFYLNRTDVVGIDSYGRFNIIKGDEKINSAPPRVDQMLIIAEVFVPGNPALTPEEAARIGKPQYGVRIKQRGVKNSTMKDIQDLRESVERLRYYVLLSQLETSTQNLNILDENGLSRFKNGIIVDPFDDISIANVEDADYSAAVNFTEKSLTPSVRSFPLNLKVSGSTNAGIYPTENFPEVATLVSSEDVPIISQRYATSFRNCVSNFYNYAGTGALSPEFDIGYDMTTNPVQVNLDFATPLQEFAQNLHELYPLTSTSSSVIETANSSFVTRIRGNNNNTITNVTSQRIEDTVRSLQVGSTTQTQNVGEFVSNFEFNPFIRAREISIFMTGLRPLTRHHFFFDRENVDEFVAPGTNVNSAREVQRSGAFGDPISSDERGVIRATFMIPEGRYFVGDRVLQISDVDTFSSISSASTSGGTITYRAYNFSVEKSNLTISTRMPETNINTATSTRTVTSQTTRIINPPRVNTDWEGAGAPNDDPLAQTFFIKKGMGRDSNTVFVSKIDLYFKRKSATNGVTVMLREVINGYPAFEILPFSKIHLTSEEVNISDDSSLATTIEFTSPVRLDVEKEYCVVVMPDANDPDYLIYTSKVGGTNLIDGSPVTQDWGDGVLFTSTNNRAWKSEQDEDVKFTLYRANFATASGTVSLTNEDHEFLINTNNIGRFAVGEFVYTEKALQGGTANTVTATAGSNEITGTSLSGSFAANDYFIIDNGTSKDLLRVVSSTLSSIIADKPATISGSATIVPIVKGTLINYDFRNPENMILEKSSAATRVTGDRLFEATNIVYGFDSGARATIATVENINLSYIQPMIMKTNDSVTSTRLVGQFTDPSDTNVSYGQNLSFNDQTNFNNRGVVLFSKSNDLDNERPFILQVGMDNGGNPTSTPFVDLETAMIFAYQYKVTSETTTTSKYISKAVELAEGLDAEDFQMFITGYRPQGSDIRVYIRPQNQYDPVTFESNDWIELELTEGISTFSSASNLNDFREFVYRVPATAKNAGVITYTNTVGTFETYRKFAIRIDLLSENIFNVPRLLDYRGIALT